MGTGGVTGMKKLLLHPLFLLGLVLRIALILAVEPRPVSSWFVPFLDASTAVLTLDPWTHWTAIGGDLAAFPYGYAMWFAMLPLTVLCKLVGLPLRFGYATTLLAADFCVLLALLQLQPKRQRLLLIAYWLSPIVILSSYGLGFNDLMPAVFFVLALLCIRQVELGWAGALVATAVSAKLSMVLAVPFFVIYVHHNRALRPQLPKLVLGFALGALLLGAPFVASKAALGMLLGNPEMGKIYRLALGLGGSVVVYVVPLIYTVMLYLAWRVRRLNFDLFLATLGLDFLVIVLLTPASPGWFIWSLPFLAVYQALRGRVVVLLIGAFSVLYVLSVLCVSPIHWAHGSDFHLLSALHIPGRSQPDTASILHTAMVAVGIILAGRIWREAIIHNDYFRLSRRPFVIGVAGDSGAGKDTFADSIIGLFGHHSVVKLSGDDYHLWDRQKPMWQVLTHLNPRANDLESFSRDLVALTDGKSIESRHYDHATGKMSKRFLLKSNDFIVACGLHALYLPLLRDCYHLKIYLDIDEDLRRFFKIRRDVTQRGHSVDRALQALEKREPDSQKYIRPQAAFADLTFSLQPIHAGMLERVSDKTPLRLKLVARTKNGLNELSLNRVLVGVCGLHVEMKLDENGSELQLEGETSAEDVALAAELLCPRVLEFLDTRPEWQDGVGGLMQLITLSHINQALTKRIIW